MQPQERKKDSLGFQPSEAREPGSKGYQILKREQDSILSVFNAPSKDTDEKKSIPDITGF
jgi:hypothetical protein